VGATCKTFEAQLSESLRTRLSIHLQGQNTLLDSARGILTKLGDITLATDLLNASEVTDKTDSMTDQADSKYLSDRYQTPASVELDPLLGAAPCIMVTELNGALTLDGHHGASLEQLNVIVSTGEPYCPKGDRDLSRLILCNMCIQKQAQHFGNEERIFLSPWTSSSYRP
jgi:hypothetical protein